MSIYLSPNYLKKISSSIHFTGSQFLFVCFKLIGVHLQMEQKSLNSADEQGNCNADYNNTNDRH